MSEIGNIKQSSYEVSPKSNLLNSLVYWGLLPQIPKHVISHKSHHQHQLKLLNQFLFWYGSGISSFLGVFAELQKSDC